MLEISYGNKRFKGTAKEFLLNEVNYASEQCEFTYIEQQLMLGLGNAIYTGKPLIGNEPFAGNVW